MNYSSENVGRLAAFLMVISLVFSVVVFLFFSSANVERGVVSSQVVSISPGAGWDNVMIDTTAVENLDGKSEKADAKP